MSPRALAFVLGFVLVGCAARASFKDGIYADGEVRYRLGSVADAWRSVRVEGAQVALLHEGTGATLFAFGECGRGDAPLQARRGHLLIGLTDRVFVSERKETLDGREALRTRLRAKLDGVPVVLETVVVKKDGCSFDLVFTAPPERFEARLTDFGAFVRGFAKLAEPAR